MVGSGHCGQHAASTVLNTPPGNGRDIKAGLSHASLLMSYLLLVQILRLSLAWWNIRTKSIETLLCPGHLHRYTTMAGDKCTETKTENVENLNILVVDCWEVGAFVSVEPQKPCPDFEIRRYGNIYAGTGQATAGLLQSPILVGDWWLSDWVQFR